MTNFVKEACVESLDETLKAEKSTAKEDASQHDIKTMLKPVPNRNFVLACNA